MFKSAGGIVAAPILGSGWTGSFALVRRTLR